MNPETPSHVSGARRLVTGLALALALTLASFLFVWAKPPAGNVGLSVLAGLAIVQMLVHLRYFLHMSWRDGKRDINLAVILAVVVIVIMVGGTIWIMHNLDMRMMPGTM
jgi:cytochrome o ubiquinol oxidase operon protein cyoD